MPDNIELDVAAVLAEALGVELMEASYQHSRLVEDLGAESLDMLDIDLGLHKKFDIPRNFDTVKQFNTVGEVVAYVRGQMSRRP